MSTVAQRCVPIHAAKRALDGDKRALLAIPEARDYVERYPYYNGDYQIPGYRAPRGQSAYVGTFTTRSAAELIRDRRARRQARLVAEAARYGMPNRIASMRSDDSVVTLRRIWRLKPKTRDARVLLRMPDARQHVEALVAGERFRADDDRMKATDIGTPKAIAAARIIIADRRQRQIDRAIAEAARTGTSGQIAAKAAIKIEAKRQAKLAAEAKRIAAKLARVSGLIRQAEHFRTASQGTTLWVEFGTPGVKSETEEGWIDYKSHGYRKGIKHHDITITVSEDYERRTHSYFPRTVDGMLTLDAMPTVVSIDGATTGIEVFRAIWAGQGRGLAIDIHRGFIARHTDADGNRTWFHSEHSDPAKAVTGLKRKMTAQGVPPEVRDARRQASAVARAAKQAAGIARLVDRLSKWDFTEIQHVVVSREDSLRAGNCTSGTDAFIHRFFPDRDVDRATVGEIAGRIGTLDIRALAGADLTLGRQLAAAVLVAIRKDRQARRALMI